MGLPKMPGLTSETARQFTRPGRSDPSVTGKNKEWWDIVLPGHDMYSTPGSPEPPEMSEQERAIIMQMKEIAAGDPELSKLYKDYTMRAISGEEGVTPAMERGIREAEEVEREQVARGLGSKGDIASTPGIQRMGRFYENVAAKKEEARRGAVGRGERLISEDYDRRIRAAGAALGPLAQQRGLMSAADRQRWLNEAAATAGGVELATTLGSAYETGRRRRGAGLTDREEPEIGYA